MKYVCELCGLIYDEEAGYPAKGIAPGTKFEDLPETFECPGCYSERNAFYKYQPRGEMKTPQKSDAATWHHPDFKSESER